MKTSHTNKSWLFLLAILKYAHLYSIIWHCDVNADEENRLLR
jgi:hypothetical protein